MGSKDQSQTAIPLRQRPGRVAILNVQPELDGGRYLIKRVTGEEVLVKADILADGHEILGAVVQHRPEKQKEWDEVPMAQLGNDCWSASFRVLAVGRHLYTIRAWIDEFNTWRRDLIRRVEAGQQSAVDLLIGAELIAQAAARAAGEDAREMLAAAEFIRTTAPGDLDSAVQRALAEVLAEKVGRHPNEGLATTYEKTLRIVVDREKARFSAWYEMFPRSCASQPGEHGTFKDCIARLPYVAGMGFDVLYFPPIHPIGSVHRKGKNNNIDPAPEDPGSPWAIGSEQGGHKAIHPDLGTLEDFQELRQAAQEYGLEIALDLAFQCAPDHPYVREHPEWFRIRPDGTVQFAENPPKKYEDIVPLNFDVPQWRELWTELKSVVLYWIQQGVRIFRVDNPHTKPLPFWEWLIGEIKRDYPDVLFLAEAFTRPKMMYELAKRGFCQSYTYFAWRNTRWDLTQYFKELTETDVCEFFRPNLWPNTPDILTEYLQVGGRPAFLTRLVLAATLGTSYGIYGPAFELCERRALRPGSEEYLDSEKYQVRQWEITSPGSLRELIARVNWIRKENPPLQANARLKFHGIDNQEMIVYSKAAEDLSSVVLVVVNLDPYHVQSGWVDLDLESLGVSPHEPYQVHDLLTDARYFWEGPRNYVELNPAILPAHIFRVRRWLRSERDFDYYM